MGGRAAASFASYVMDNVSNSLYDADPIVIMSDVELRFDYDRYGDATIVPVDKSFPNISLNN